MPTILVGTHLVIMLLHSMPNSGRRCFCMNTKYSLQYMEMCSSVPDPKFIAVVRQLLISTTDCTCIARIGPGAQNHGNILTSE
eukprot:2232868-Amphidinium_carterae.1